ARLPEYAVRKSDATLAAADLQKQLNRTADEVARTSPSPADRATFDRERHDIAAEIDQLAGANLLRKEIEAGVLSAKREQIAAQIDALRHYSQPRTPADWLGTLPALATASQRINSYWDQWKK